MKFLLLIAYTDLSDNRARVHVEPIEMETEDAAKAYAEQVKDDAEQVMDLIYSLDNWRSWPEVQGLKGKKIFDAHGFHVGDVEVWTLDKLVQFCPDSPWDEDDEDEAA